MAQPVFNLSRHTRHEVFEAILQSLNSMPDQLRKVFVLNHYQGVPVSEIAQTLGRSEKQVKAALEQANLHFFDEVKRLRIKS